MVWIGPYTFIGSGIIRRCGVDGVDVVLLKEGWHYGSGLSGILCSSFSQ